jgi:hypothetical protein
LDDMYKNNEWGQNSYRALQATKDELGKQIDNTIENYSPENPENAWDLEKYNEAKQIYENMKKISLPLAKSAVLESRAASLNMPQQFARIVWFDPMQVITNPVWALKSKALNAISDAVADKNSRSGALRSYFNVLDMKAKTNQAPKILLRHA